MTNESLNAGSREGTRLYIRTVKIQVEDAILTLDRDGKFAGLETSAIGRKFVLPSRFDYQKTREGLTQECPDGESFFSRCDAEAASSLDCFIRRFAPEPL